jgi:hypothetical protein
MTTERHLDQLGAVLAVNAAAWIPTAAGFEQTIRVAGLILAAIYTSLKIIELIRKK